MAASSGSRFFRPTIGRQPGVARYHRVRLRRHSRPLSECKSWTAIAKCRNRCAARKLIELNGGAGDVDAIIQVGTNLSMVRLAAAAEMWLGKPVIAINTATYWHAALERDPDKIPGLGRCWWSFEPPGYLGGGCLVRRKCPSRRDGRMFPAVLVVIRRRSASASIFERARSLRAAAGKCAPARGSRNSSS